MNTKILMALIAVASKAYPKPTHLSQDYNRHSHLIPEHNSSPDSISFNTISAIFLLTLPGCLTRSSLPQSPPASLKNLPPHNSSANRSTTSNNPAFAASSSKAALNNLFVCKCFSICKYNARVVDISFRNTLCAVIPDGPKSATPLKHNSSVTGAPRASLNVTFTDGR